jgi:hypothetical protein
MVLTSMILRLRMFSVIIIFAHYFFMMVMKKLFLRIKKFTNVKFYIFIWYSKKNNTKHIKGETHGDHDETG